MSIRTATVAAVAACSLAGVASATEPTFTFCFNGGDAFLLSGGQSITQQLTGLSGTLTGFEIEIQFDPLNSTGSWASDGAFIVPGAGQWGGFNVLFGPPFNAFWSFDGPGSAAAGLYSDFQSLANPVVYNPGDTLDFVFGNGWSGSGQVQYEVCVTLFGVIPTPGGLALLGFAGLAGSRRRRS